MKKLLYLLFLIPSLAFSADGTVYVIDKLAPKNGAFVGVVDSSQTVNNVTNFNNNLSGADTTVQKALDTLDDMTAVGSGSDIYPATSTASFPYGVSASTISVSTITASDIGIFNSGGFFTSRIGDDSNNYAGYFNAFGLARTYIAETDPTRSIYYALASEDESSTYIARLISNSPTYAGYFTDSTNEVTVADGTNAMVAEGPVTLQTSDLMSNIYINDQYGPIYIESQAGSNEFMIRIGTNSYAGTFNESTTGNLVYLAGSDFMFKAENTSGVIFSVHGDSTSVANLLSLSSGVYVANGNVVVSSGSLNIAHGSATISTDDFRTSSVTYPLTLIHEVDPSQSVATYGFGTGIDFKASANPWEIEQIGAMDFFWKDQDARAAVFNLNLTGVTPQTVMSIDAAANMATFPGNVTADAYYGDGSNLTGITSGGVSVYPATSTASLPYGTSASTITVNVQSIHKLASFDSEYNIGDSGAEKVIDWNNGNFQKITLNTNCTVTFIDPANLRPSRLQLKVIQDASGNHTITLPEYSSPGSIDYNATVSANAIDIVTFYFDGSNYYLVASNDFENVDVATTPATTGWNIYPATATASFNYGLSASTISVIGDVTADSYYVSSGTVDGQLTINSDLENSYDNYTIFRSTYYYLYGGINKFKPNLLYSYSPNDGASGTFQLRASTKAYSAITMSEETGSQTINWNSDDAAITLTPGYSGGQIGFNSGDFSYILNGDSSVWASGPTKSNMMFDLGYTYSGYPHVSGDNPFTITGGALIDLGNNTPTYYNSILFGDIDGGDLRRHAAIVGGNNTGKGLSINVSKRANLSTDGTTAPEERMYFEDNCSSCTLYINDAVNVASVTSNGPIGASKFYGISNGIKKIVPFSHMMQGTFDLAAQYDVDSDLWLIDLNADTYPAGIVITKWYVDANVADPTTELDANLMYCDAVAGDAFPGANPVLIDVLNTTTGNSSETNMASSDLGSGVIPIGKSIYIDLDADPTDANTVYHVRIHYYIAEN